MKNWLAHINTYGVRNLDATTLRHIRDFCQDRVLGHELLLADVRAQAGTGEETLLFCMVFADDYRVDRAALAKAQAELDRRGV